MCYWFWWTKVKKKRTRTRIQKRRRRSSSSRTTTTTTYWSGRMLFSIVFMVSYIWCMARWVQSSSYLSWCIKRMRAIINLDNARCALFRLVIARLQAVERAFTEKSCMLHGLKGGEVASCCKYTYRLQFRRGRCPQRQTSTF